MHIQYTYIQSEMIVDITMAFTCFADYNNTIQHITYTTQQISEVLYLTCYVAIFITYIVIIIINVFNEINKDSIWGK